MEPSDSDSVTSRGTKRKATKEDIRTKRQAMTDNDDENESKSAKHQKARKEYGTQRKAMNNKEDSDSDYDNGKQHKAITNCIRTKHNATTDDDSEMTVNQ